jgi:hypothetical protein
MVTFLNKETLTTKRSLIFIGLTVVCGSYLLFLGILAPQQLAEATTAATNVICRGCVGSSDIADNSIRSADIQNGQVTTADIGAGQVLNGDIGTAQVTSNKISDIDGVNSVDIVDGEVGAADIANDAIAPDIEIVNGDQITFPHLDIASRSVDCPEDRVVTGGGFTASRDVIVRSNHAEDENTWFVSAQNLSGQDATLAAQAVCLGPMP